MANEIVANANLQVRQNLEEASLLMCGVRGIIDVLFDSNSIESAERDALFGAARLLSQAKEIVDRSSENLTA